MKKFKKTIALVSAMTILAAVCSCGKKAETNVEKGNVVFGEDELNFSFYYHNDAFSAKEWPSNEADQWLMDNKKVSIEYIDAGGASSEKLATMIVAGEFPDLIQIEKGQESQKLIENGCAVPINEYIEKYPNMRERLEKRKIFSLLTQDDGNIYEIPNWPVVTEHLSGNQCWALNKNIYEELGSPEIKNFNDLYEYLKQVKANYPDVVPYETTNEFEGERFVLSGMSENIVPENLTYFAYADGEKLTSIFKHPNYEKTWLFLNKLFREKLITQDAFSQSYDQFLEKLSTGRVAVCSTVQGVVEKARAEFIKTGNDYITITPLMEDGLNRDNVYVTGCDTTGWTEFLITKDADNPEAIFAFLDWLCTNEGQALELLGIPGKLYDGFNEEGYPEPTEAYKQLKDASSLEKLSFTHGTTWWDDASFYMNSQGLPEEAWPWGGKQHRKNIWPYVKDTTEYNGILPSASTDEGLIYQNIFELHKEMKAKLLFAKSEDEVKVIVKQLVAQSDELGMDKLLAYETERWQKNKAKLGIE